MMNTQKIFYTAAIGITLMNMTSCSTAVQRKLANSEPRLVRSEYVEGELSKLCQSAIDNTRQHLDRIAAIPAEQRTIENTLLDFEAATADFTDLTAPLTFMGYVSTQEKIAAEGAACEERVGKFGVEVLSRKDIYDAVRGAKPRDESETRLLSETVRAFEINGLKLPQAKLKRVRDLKSELAGLEAQFAAYLNKDATSVEFEASELEGVSAEFLNRLKKNDAGRYIVTTKNTDYTQVMENAKSSETRRKMMAAYFNRAADKNVATLEQAIALRQQIARVMGFATWADYKTQNRMVKNGKTVMTFLKGLREKLSKRNQADLAKLLAFKKSQDPTATRLDLWDVAYCSYQLKKRDYSLDDDLIREYFPAEVVIQGMFEVYSKLLGVRFVQVSGADVWSSEVKLYRIENIADGTTVGYFYADFFPRPGKYGHAAAFPLVAGRKLPDGSYSQPVAAIVSNMNPPAGGKPSLLNHGEVETLFHEFGHIMHQTLTRAPYASLAGSSTAQDFVEAPSQMLENWVWSPEILASLSGHYSDPTRKLPKETLDRMIAAKDFNQGYFYTRQLMLGLMDMAYHTAKGKVDTTAVQDKLYREIIGVEPIPGGHFQAGFGHLMGGYDAGYYGYLWSKVYAQDMFTQFAAKGVLSSEVGMNYRRHILEMGNMKDAIELLRAFLGREPNSDAFFKSIGVEAHRKSRH